MSSFTDLPSSKGAVRGGSFLSSLKKVFKTVPIASTAASFLPGVGKLAAPILASQGYGKGKKGRKSKAKRVVRSQNGGINLKKLTKSIARSGVVGDLLAMGPGKKSQTAAKLVKSLGGKRKRVSKKKVLKKVL